MASSPSRRPRRTRARGLVSILVAVAAVAGWTGAEAGSTEVERLRMARDDDRTRLVFDLGGPVQHQLFTLADPHRIVIDIEDVRVDGELPEAVPVSDRIERIRSAPRNGDDLRVVLDLRSPARPKSFALRPQGDYGHRLVVDVLDGGAAESRRGQADRPAAGPRDLVIAIDAGHGGRDPGALGPGGVREKDIVLSVSRRLKALLARTPGLRPVMTRERDVFLALRERIRRAREAKADLFVSIHADAFRNARARGSSVYALSINGASSEAAKWLADRENAADLVGGVSLQDKDDMVASVLLDLSQTATIESSLNVGAAVLSELGSVNDLHKHSVQQAGFVVLKSPDIPSILVETAFISNPHEARELRSSRHQQALARAIRDGIRRYFKERAPPGSRFYARN